MTRMRFAIAWPLCIVATCLLAPPGRCAPGAVAAADSLRLTGHTREALEAYRRASSSEPVAAAIGTARCRESEGALDQAVETLRAAALRHPTAPALHAELARLEFGRGRYDAARRVVDAALALDADHCGARWSAAELHRVAGRLDAANEAYRWFIAYYNAHDTFDDPEVLRWIGLAAAQYARWNRNSDQFSFLVNTLYPKARRLAPLYWPAHLEAALLFAEKFNRTEAIKDLEAAFAINPHAAELHAARAWIALQTLDFDGAKVAIDSALAIHPRLLWARQLAADRAMLLDGPRAAVPLLEEALALNPVDEETLGRLAAVYGASDGLRDDPSGTRMGGVIERAVKQNEHCGTFFAVLGESLDRLRKYPHAIRYYEESRRRMPQLITVPGPLGLVYMRLGDEARAAKLLEEAFELDPFNARVINTRKVLDLLSGYGVIETDHFTLRFDPAQDDLLARYAARYLEEEVHPEIVRALGFEPPGKSLFEIFGPAKGTSGHGWFSMRMVGMPFIGTVGACAGKVVAIASPNDTRSRYNWARVLKHEFVHVVNLQQTDFNIPHWFTEALAVYHEGGARPVAWEQVLARRAAANRLFDLGTINLGFVRPSSSEDWTLAYCQAELYAEYMVSTYGGDALSKMIAAYKDNLDTRTALQRSFGVDQDAFERGYRKHLDALVAGFQFGQGLPPPRDLATLTREVEQRPQDGEALAQTAYAFLRTGLGFRARTFAGSALAIDPRHALAAWVMAQVHVSEGDVAQAVAVLRAALDPDHPSEFVLLLLADLSVRQGDHAEAERLCRIGVERFPSSGAWNPLLAVVFRNAGEKQKLAEVLERMAERDADVSAPRAELAQLAMDRGDAEAAGRWAMEVLFIDVRDAAAHALLGRAASGAGKSDAAMEEYETAIRLRPEANDWRLALAKACIEAKQKDRARRALTDLLARDAEHSEARQLLDSLGR